MNPPPTPPSHDCPAADDVAALRTAVTGLAREVETVRRALDVTATAADLARVADLVTDLSQIVNATTATTADPPPSWLTLPADLDAAATVLADLVGWLGHVYLRYSDARGLPECWLWHPDVVEELVWLRHAWHDAYKSGDASIRGVGDWHDRLRPGVTRRITAYTKACSLETHLPDRASGAVPVPAADAIGPIAGWWVGRRTAPGPAPTDEQLHAAATAARRLRAGAR